MDEIKMNIDIKELKSDDWEYDTMRGIQRLCHKIAKSKGFWDKPRNDGELIALMHSELSECLEELRKKKPDIKLIAEELADCIIRICDFAEAKKIDLEQAIFEKLAYNKKRPYKHGKQF